MKDSSGKRGILLGLFVFVGILLLIAGVLLIGNLRGTFTRKMKVVAIFDDVSGLQAGNNVWFSGVKIGTVSQVNIYDESVVSVLVNIELNAQEFIRKDAKIKISTDGLIGNKILVIYGGTAGLRQINAGDTLRVEKTFSSEDMVNMLQANNENILAITSDFKAVSAEMAAGEGTIGKLLMDETIYDHVNKTAASLDEASTSMMQMINSLNAFSKNLNKAGGLAHQLVTDTTTFPAIQASVVQLEQIMDTAAVFIQDLKSISSNTDTPLGVFLQDEHSGTQLKQVIENLESSSYKLDEDLEAIQHNFLFRRYFRKKAKQKEKENETG